MSSDNKDSKGLNAKARENMEASAGLSEGVLKKISELEAQNALLVEALEYIAVDECVDQKDLRTCSAELEFSKTLDKDDPAFGFSVGDFCNPCYAKQALANTAQAAKERDERLTEVLVAIEADTNYLHGHLKAKTTQLVDDVTGDLVDCVRLPEINKLFETAIDPIGFGARVLAVARAAVEYAEADFMVPKPIADKCKALTPCDKKMMGAE